MPITNTIEERKLSKKSREVNPSLGMETKARTMDAEKLCKEIDRKKLNFDIPIQRTAGVWNSFQKSLFIDTMIRGYKAPDIWILRTSTSQYEANSVIDGCQRCSTIYDFINNKFRLVKKGLKPVVIDGVTYDICGKKFKNLPEIIQDKIKDYSVSETQMINYTDEEVDEQFYRLTCNAPFTKQQTANVLLGSEIAAEVKEVERMEFWNRCNFTTPARKNGDVKVCILQCLMAVCGYEFKNFGAGEILKFAKEYQTIYDPEDFAYLKSLVEKLHEALPTNDENDAFLKKVNIPMLVLNAEKYMEAEQKGKMTLEQYTDFLENWINKESEEVGYSELCGSGSTNKEKVEKRIELTNSAMEKYISEEHVINSKQEEIDENEDDSEDEDEDIEEDGEYESEDGELLFAEVYNDELDDLDDLDDSDDDDDEDDDDPWKGREDEMPESVRWAREYAKAHPEPQRKSVALELSRKMEKELEEKAEKERLEKEKLEAERTSS